MSDLGNSVLCLEAVFSSFRREQQQQQREWECFVELHASSFSFSLFIYWDIKEVCDLCVRVCTSWTLEIYSLCFF